jgi:phosphoglycerate kinase
MTKTFRTLDDIGDVRGKRALVRVDLNVPMKGGEVSDDTRIRAVADTINELADKGAKVLLLAHFGRPKGKADPAASLEPVTKALAAVIGRPVGFVRDCIGEDVATAADVAEPGDVLLLENTRFHAGEEANDRAFAEDLAANGDLYVNDAFSAAHRAHASTEALAHLLPAFAGRAMERELTALEKALGAPRRPLVAVVGGAKVSSKIDLLKNLVKKVDALIIGGGMANTFLAALGVDVGRSLHERDLTGTAREIMEAAEAANCTIVLPKDAIAAASLEPGVQSVRIGLDEGVPEDGMILDIGPASVEIVKAEFDQARTLVWNGPLGAFEVEPFDRATVAAARHAADLTGKGRLMSVAGGGDTVAALNKAGVADRFSYVSAAGGAFLEWLEGKPLPGVEALKR